MADGFYFNTETHQVEEGRQSDYTKLDGPVPHPGGGDARRWRPRGDATRPGTSRTRRAESAPFAGSRRSADGRCRRWRVHGEVHDPPRASVDEDVVDRCGQQARCRRRPRAVGRLADLAGRVDAGSQVVQPRMVECRVHVAGDDHAGCRRASVGDQCRVLAPRRPWCAGGPGEIECAATRTGEAAGSAGPRAANRNASVGSSRRGSAGAVPTSRSSR